MGKIVSRALVLAAMAGAFTTPTVMAEGEYSANIGVASEYVWRGVSQSDEDLAIWGGVDYANEYFYLGTWAANVDFGPGSDATFEWDVYGGFSDTLESGLTWDVGVIAYFYPDADGEDLDFYEVYGGLGFGLTEALEVGGYVYFDPDNENTYVEGTAGYAFNDSFGADVSLGSYSFDGGDDYVNWSVGGTYSAAGLDFDLRYWDTDIEGPGGAEVDGSEERIVFSVTKSFG
jgi:uncharacterized protein (TIGR02001 family)